MVIHGTDEFIFADALGAWIVLGLCGHAPASSGEADLARATGQFLLNTFHSWWGK